VVCRPPHTRRGDLSPVGYGKLGAVKRQIEHRPGGQGSISSGTRLGGAQHKKVIGDFTYHFFCVRRIHFAFRGCLPESFRSSLFQKAWLSRRARRSLVATSEIPHRLAAHGGGMPIREDWQGEVHKCGAPVIL